MGSIVSDIKLSDIETTSVDVTKSIVNLPNNIIFDVMVDKIQKRFNINPSSVETLSKSTSQTLVVPSQHVIVPPNKKIKAEVDLHSSVYKGTVRYKAKSIGQPQSQIETSKSFLGFGGSLYYRKP